VTAALSRVLGSRAWQLSFALLAAAVLLCYHYVDIPVAEFFRDYRGTLFYKTANILTRLGDGHWYLVPPLLLFFFYRKRSVIIARASLFVFATSAVSGILVNLLKILFGRFRPKLYFREELYGFDWFHLGHAYNSFPSGHSTTVIGGWLAFTLIAPKYRVAFLSVGVLLALTRVAVTAHYVSDILAGGFLGATVTLVCYRMMYDTPSRGAVK
jgi:membrane-associated phospholipid phosphatase